MDDTKSNSSDSDPVISKQLNETTPSNQSLEDSINISEDEDDILTDEQSNLIATAVDMCPFKTIEECKSTLQRHNWDLNRAAMELLSVDSALSQPNSTHSTIPQTPSSLEDIQNIQPLISNSETALPEPIFGQQLRRRRIPEFFSANDMMPSSRPTYSQALNRNRLRNQSVFTRFYNKMPNFVKNIFNLISYYASISVRFLKIPLNAICSSTVQTQPTTNQNLSLIARVSQTFIGSIKSPESQVQDSIKLFKQDFPEYSLLNFENCSYNSVLSKAKSDIKFVIVYVHVKEHGETETFLKNVREKLANFTTINNILLWMCDLNTREGQKTANELCIVKYPALCLLAPSSSARVSCISQIFNSNSFDQFEEAKINYSSELVILKDEKLSRIREQQLRIDQQNEYEKAMSKDKQMIENREKERQVKIKKDQEKQLKIDILEEAKNEAKCLVEKEVDVELNEVCKVVIKLPSGKRLEKKFNFNMTIRHLRAVILLEDEINMLDFEIVSQFPPKTYNDESLTIKHAFNSKTQLLFIKGAQDENIESSEESSDSSD